MTYKHDHNCCLSLTRPDLDSLRNHSTPILSADQTLIDPSLLQSYARDKLVDKEFSLMCTHLLDRGRGMDLTNTTWLLQQIQHVPVASGVSMCLLHQHVVNASFYTPLSTVKHPMCHLFSKGLNRKGQIRMFPLVAIREMKQNGTVLSQIKQLFLISLLGNYKHIPANQRPGMAARVQLYQWFDSSEKQNIHIEWLYTLIGRCEDLLINIMREFMFFSVRSHPVLESRINEMTNLDIFQSIVTDAMGQIRNYFNIYSTQATSALMQSMYNTPKGKACRQRVCWDLNQLSNPSHDRVLKVKYEGPKLKPEQFLVRLRKMHPMVLMPKYKQQNALIVDPGSIDDSDVSDTEYIDVRPIENEKVDNELPQIDSLQGIPGLADVLADMNTSVTINSSASSELYLYKIVSEDVYRSLQCIVSRCQPHDIGALTRCLDKIGEFFCIKPELIQYIQKLIMQYEEESVRVEKLKKLFSSLQKYEPYVYNLVQIGADLIREAQRHFSWSQLPLELVRYQLQACQARIKSVPNAVYPSSLYFVFCPVCNSIYSLVRMFPNRNSVAKPKNQQGPYKQSYRFGYRDVVCSYTTDEMYCRRDKHTTIGKCGEHPLAKFLLLGRVLIFDGSEYQICAQLNCGLPMLVDRDRCAYTDRGPCCYDCTRQLQHKPKWYVDIVAHYSVHRLCLYCNMRLATENSTHLFPFDLYICKKHASNQLIAAVEERMQDKELPAINRDLLQVFMTEFIIQRKRNYTESKQNSYKMQLNLSKLNNKNKNKNHR